ncbi:hypothetical protein P7M34_24600, partial [Vibrio parahaemolyticus]|nr:hypothetical protein [Vibrio parahaemolyticus]
ASLCSALTCARLSETSESMSFAHPCLHDVTRAPQGETTVTTELKDNLHYGLLAKDSPTCLKTETEEEQHFFVESYSFEPEYKHGTQATGRSSRRSS